MVISVASCLITMVSIESVHVYSVPGHTIYGSHAFSCSNERDWFSWAGVILRRSNDVISGLTTASMVWAASALGIAIGAGFYLQATVYDFLAFKIFNL